MTAKMHSEMCLRYALDLKQELLRMGEDVSPVFHIAYYKRDDSMFNSLEKTLVYCHPLDKQQMYIKDFKYPHREI